MIRENLIKYILDVFPMVHRRLFKELREQKIQGSHNKILFAIMNDNGQPMNHYCEKLLISKPNFTKAAKRLINDGYVERVNDEKDRRIIKLSITEEGRKRITANRVIMNVVLQKKFEQLSDEDIETLISSFKTIESIFDKLED